MGKICGIAYSTWIITLLFIFHKEGFAHSPSEPKPQLYRITIDKIGPAILPKIKSLKEIIWWAELDDVLLVKAKTTLGQSLPPPLKADLVKVRWSTYQLSSIKGANRFHFDHQNLQILAYGGRSAIVAHQAKLTRAKAHAHWEISPFKPNRALARQMANYAPPAKTPKRQAKTRQVVERIDANVWLRYVEELSTINRYAYHDQGTSQSEAWIINAFSKIPSMEVTRQKFSLGQRPRYNIIGKLSSAAKNAKIIIVGAHYDSTSEIAHRSAPGAEDNASGTAALVEIAKSLANEALNTHVWFIGFGAEEQGLFGSKAYVESLLDQQIKGQIAAVFTMDMIGFSDDDQFDILIETSESNQPLIEELHQRAEAYTSIDLSSTYDYWGSDHVPFIDRGFPAVLVIENDYMSYPHYHRSTDLPKEIKRDQGLQVMRMLAATIFEWEN